MPRSALLGKFRQAIGREVVQGLHPVPIQRTRPQAVLHRLSLRPWRAGQVPSELGPRHVLLEDPLRAVVAVREEQPQGTQFFGPLTEKKHVLLGGEGGHLSCKAKIKVSAAKPNKEIDSRSLPCLPAAFKLTAAFK